MSKKKYEFLESSKKRTATNRWEYRGFSVEKMSYNSWIVKKIKENAIVNVSSEKLEEVLKIEASTAKDVCLEMDKVLGQLSNKKKQRKIPIIKDKPVVSLANKEKVDVDDAKRIAYEFRMEIEKKLKLIPNSDIKNAIPVRRREVNKKTFLLGWNQNFEFVDEIIIKFEEKYNKEFEFDLQKEDNTLDLIVKIK
jgi:hypothetical protein